MAQVKSTNESNEATTEDTNSININTALSKAIKEGNLDQVITLVEQNEQVVDEQIEEGIKPAHLAIRYGHLHIVEWLLKHGVSIECATVPNAFVTLGCFE